METDGPKLKADQKNLLSLVNRLGLRNFRLMNRMDIGSFNHFGDLVKEKLETIDKKAGS